MPVYLLGTIFVHSLFTTALSEYMNVLGLLFLPFKVIAIWLEIMYKSKQTRSISEDYAPQNNMVVIMILRGEGAVGPQVEWLHSAPLPGLKKMHQEHRVNKVCQAHQVLFFSNKAEHRFIFFSWHLGRLGLKFAKIDQIVSVHCQMSFMHVHLPIMACSS